MLCSLVWVTGRVYKIFYILKQVKEKEPTKCYMKIIQIFLRKHKASIKKVLRYQLNTNQLFHYVTVNIELFIFIENLKNIKKIIMRGGIKKAL